MNVQSPIAQRDPLDLTVSMFQLLKQSGAFNDYIKSELIDGELFGVPRHDDHEQQSDAVVPIKLTVENFLLLVESGALPDYPRTELIGGSIVAMNAQYSLHAHVKSLLFRRIADACDVALPAHHVWTEVALIVSPNDLVEPDILVTDFAPSARAPVPAATVLLIVEVSDTTLNHDLGKKAEIHAAAGIPEYWVVDINARLIHQMWAPEGSGYMQRREHRFGEAITAATIKALAIDTRALI
jgi:Uma2 family endonuclease